MVYLEQASEQVYKKKLSGDNRSGIKDSPVYLSQGSLDTLMNFALTVFLSTNLGQLRSVFFTGEARLPADEHIGESRLHGVKTTRELFKNTNNSLNIRNNLKSFPCMSHGTKRSCLMKKSVYKISQHCPFNPSPAVVICFPKIFRILPKLK